VIVEAIEATEAENVEEKMEQKIEDVFESARRAFFSPEGGKDSPLSNTERFTQVKSFDAPQLNPSAVK
jgi:hypothetical protein